MKYSLKILILFILLVGCDKARMGTNADGRTTSFGKPIFRDTAQSYWIDGVSGEYYDLLRDNTTGERSEDNKLTIAALEKLMRTLSNCGLRELSLPNCERHDFTKYSVIYNRVLKRGSDFQLKTTILQDRVSKKTFFLTIENFLDKNRTYYQPLQGFIAIINNDKNSGGETDDLGFLAKLASQKLAAYPSTIYGAWSISAALGLTTVGNIYFGEQSTEHFLEALVEPTLDIERLYYLIQFLFEREDYRANVWKLEKRLRPFLPQIVKSKSDDLRSRYFKRYVALLDDYSMATRELAEGLALERTYQSMPDKLWVCARAAQTLSVDKISPDVKGKTKRALLDTDDSRIQLDALKAIHRLGKDVLSFSELRTYIQKQTEISPQMRDWAVYAVRGFTSRDAHTYLIDLIANGEENFPLAQLAFGAFNIVKYDVTIERYLDQKIQTTENIALVDRLKELRERVKALKGQSD